MADNKNQSDKQNNRTAVERSKEQNAESADVSRTGSTGSDINAGEWRLNDENKHRAHNPETGSTGLTHPEEGNDNHNNSQ